MIESEKNGRHSTFINTHLPVCSGGVTVRKGDVGLRSGGGDDGMSSMSKSLLSRFLLAEGGVDGKRGGPHLFLFVKGCWST